MVDMRNQIEGKLIIAAPEYIKEELLLYAPPLTPPSASPVGVEKP
jgi:hypothetical protein